ncbi:hypothetical protein ACAW74_27260 [Fibrella sp. WM1]|uniref:hypothetical protein n=1 Tax=Fibrella musci TaxID=3242485 RepID=UPI00351FF7B0
MGYRTLSRDVKQRNTLMESNVRLLQPEVFLYMRRYLTVDRNQYEPFGPPSWVDADRAYRFAQGDRFRLVSYERSELTGEYVVADPPLLGTELRTTNKGSTVNVPTVTVYMVIEELWSWMKQAHDRK